MKIELERWEINYILNLLAEQKYKDVAFIVQHIKEQIEDR